MRIPAPPPSLFYVISTDKKLLGTSIQRLKSALISSAQGALETAPFYLGRVSAFANALVNRLGDLQSRKGKYTLPINLQMYIKPQS